ncbi:MAG: Gldg family protein [Desulfobacteraceae bacterium]|nr:Gldg family protein [Desulfobacteraceae bacterium]
MNIKTQRHNKYIKFALYAVVVILLNVAGITLFFRVDLTKNSIYSLSPVSKKVVSTLTEPMTVKVFFTKDLPAPYNGTELYLHDLLNEYALNNKKQFKVHFYNVSAETEGVSENAKGNQQMAREYGIRPVQIQNVEQDEVKFKQAYMGLVLIHGDIVEQIPTITTTEGLEYKLTTAIQKLNHKVSALLALQDKIKIEVLLSSSFDKVGPFIGLKEIDKYPDRIKTLVEKLNAKTYDRLEYKYIDPTTAPDAVNEKLDLNAMRFSWPAIAKANIEEGKGIIGLIMEYKGQVREIPLLNVIRVPIFGNQYQLASMDQVEELINTNIDGLININQEIGYLADFGTVELSGESPLGPQGDTAGRFSELLNKNYSVKSIRLKDEPIPQGLKCLIIAGPKEKFSDYALYQIDQALMHGTNLALFVDALEEQKDNNQGLMMGNQQMRFHMPLNTGLEKMLAGYGVRIKNAIVMDEKCYRQRKPPQQGGGEQPIYFIPMIENANINKKLDYMRNIKGLFAFICSPLELDDKLIAEQKITAYKLFSSSKRSWEMRDRIMLNPMFISPPASDSEMAQRPLAYLLEGNFTSYFKGKPMPEKPAAEPKKDKSPEEDAGAAKATEEKPDAAQLQGQGTFRETSPPAKIFVIGSSKMISDQLIDENGQSPNTAFALNLIDALNDRADVAAMRSKEQQFNPLNPTGAGTKAAIKAANIVGVPLLVVVFGLIVWGRRHVRKKNIQMMFQK